MLGLIATKDDCRLWIKIFPQQWSRLMCSIGIIISFLFANASDQGPNTIMIECRVAHAITGFTYCLASNALSILVTKMFMPHKMQAVTA